MMAPVVAHQPAHHPYVDALAAASPTVVPAQFWDVATWPAHVAVAHVHFGFEHLTPAGIDDWLRAVRRRGVAVVVTVHDLHNPHLVDQRDHHERLRRLLAGAAHAVTLTGAVAAEAALVLGRTGPLEVVPHPPIIDERERPAVAEAPGPVYLHAATCRPNLDIDLAVELAEAAVQLGVGLDVHVRAGASAAPTVATRLAAAGADVRVEARPDDPTLWSWLGRASAVAVPYRWGSHSGLIEAATDLGTPALAPLLGGFADQGAWPMVGGRVATGLAAAVGSRRPADPAARRQLARINVARHRAIYERVAS